MRISDWSSDVCSSDLASLGNAEMERAIDGLGELLIGGDGEEDVARLHRDLILAEILILEQLDMVEGGFDQRLGARPAIFFEQVLLQAAGVAADPHQTGRAPCRERGCQTCRSRVSPNP